MKQRWTGTGSPAADHSRESLHAGTGTIHAGAGRRCRRSLPRCLIAFCALLAMAGCATTTSSSVDRRMVLPAGAERHQVDEDQHFLIAGLISSPMPDFPPGAGTKDGTREVCVEFVVTVDGLVEEVVFPRSEGGCARTGDDKALFEQAVSEALARWQLTGAAICTFPAGVPRDESCEGEGVLVRAVPIRLMYVFSFTQANGKRSVAAE